MEILQLLMSEHTSSCLVCDEKDDCRRFSVTVRKVGVTTGCRYCAKDGQCEFQEVAERLGVTAINYPVHYRGMRVEDEDPFYDRDHNLCILCGRCVRICQEVRVADDHRLGDVNDGWRVALTTLMNERASIGSGSGGMGSGVASIERLSGMLRHFGKSDDPVLRDELVRIWIGFQVGKLTGQRGTDKIKAGQLPGPEMSIGKLALTQNLTALSEWVSRVLGPRVTADTGEWGTYAWAEYILGTPGMRLGGGTDEVMRNIVGERVLGLPKDPGIDTTSPFRELKARARP